MPISYQQFVDQVLDVAASVNPDVLQDGESVIESIIPIVWQDVAESWYGDEKRRSILKTTITVTAVNGVVTLDDTILTSTLDDSLLYDPASTADIYSFQRNYASLFGQLDELLGYYSMEFGAQMRVVLPNTQFDPASGPSQNFSLNVAIVPPVPTSDSGDIVAPAEWISDAIDGCAKKLQAIVPAGVGPQ